MATTTPPPTLVIIAGGEGRRMGGTIKCLLPLEERTILERTLHRLGPQVDKTLLNINTPSQEISKITQALNVVTVGDNEHYPDCGPLGGIVSSLLAQQKLAPTAPGIITIPGDCPFLPKNLITILMDTARAHTNQVVCASCNSQEHYLTAFWPSSTLPALIDFLNSGERAVRYFLKKAGYQTATFPLNPQPSFDPFLNINTQEEYQFAQKLALELD